MAQSLRRVVVLCTLLAALLPLSGCWVFSVYPLAAPTDDLVYDRLLVGNWWHAQNKCSVTITRLPDDRVYHVVYVTAKDAGGACWLGEGQSASLTGIVVELGGMRFLDVTPAEMPLQNHMALTHSFYRLKVDLNSLTITPLQHEALRSLVAEDKLRGIARSDEMLVLTSDTKELRDFMRQNASNQDVWNDGAKLEFQRKFDGQ